jgi:hypothetical protein
MFVVYFKYKVEEANMKRIKNLFPLLIAALPISFGMAAATTNSTSIDKSYYIPHVYLSGYGGSNWLGEAQMIAPVWLMADRNLYIYGEGNYAAAQESDQNNSWSGDFGIGYRQILNLANKERLYGAYLLGSYNYSSYGNNFWVINPGIETLGERWDFRANGYLPVGDHSFTSKDLASNRGDYSHVHSHGNEIDDMTVNYYENIGYGADTEFGGRLFSINHMPIKGYISGYYFNVDNSDISNSKESDSSNIFGVGARVTFQPTRYLSLEVKDTYDNEQNNVIEAGIKVYLNGFRDGFTNTHVDDQDIQMRLFDPIEHNFGTISTNNSAIEHQGKADDGLVPEKTNVTFFDGNKAPDATSTADSNYAIGTAENPYAADAYNQQLVDSIHATWGDHAEFVMSGGTNAYNANGQGANVVLYENESIFGMNSDYTKLATGSDRPNIYGSLTLTDGDIIDSITLYNNYGNNSVGINVIDGSKNVMLNNLAVGSQDTDSKSFGTAVNIGQNTQVTISNSSLLGHIDNTEINAIGLNINAGSDLSIKNSNIAVLNSLGSSIGILSNGATINTLGTSITASGNTDSLGIALHNAASNVNLKNGTTISAYSVNGAAVGIGVEYDSSNKVNSIVNITGKDTKINATSEALSEPNYQGYTAAGIFAINAGNGLLQVNTNEGATINATSHTSNVGIYASGKNTTVNFNYGIINALSDGLDLSVSSYGIRLNNSTLNLNNGYITAKGAGNVAGIYAFESNVFFNTSDGLKISASSASLESNFTTAGIFLSDSNLDFSKANSSSTLSINAVNTNGKSYGIYGKKSTITAEENSKNILFGGSITPNNQIVLE